MAMNPEIKAQWTAALRSGEFSQGHGRLRSAADEFCCLGVLCELAVRAHVINSPQLAGITYIYDDQGAFLSSSVQTWASLHDTPESHLAEISKLIAANDDGLPFSAIADMIEEML